MKVINFKNKANKTVGKLEIKNINGNLFQKLLV